MGKSVEREVLRVVDDYMKGSYRADEVLLRSVFHEKAVMNGYVGTEPVVADPSPFIDDIVSAPSMESTKVDYRPTVDHVFVRGNIAAVIATEHGFRGEMKIVDCFHLIRIDGIWSIVSKLFTSC